MSSENPQTPNQEPTAPMNRESGGGESPHHAARADASPINGMTPDEAEILRARAKKFARPLKTAPDVHDPLDLFVLTTAGARYGIDSRHVMAVTPLRNVCPVPGTPPFICGIINHRGRITSVLDLARLFRLPGKALRTAGWVVVLDLPNAAIGVLSEAGTEMIRVEASDLVSPPASLLPNFQGLVRGVTSSLVFVLDVGSLPGHGAVLVNEEIAERTREGGG